MNFEDFNRRWADAFRYKLTAATSGSFAAFVEDERTNDRLVVKVLREFSEEYNAAVRAMNPHAKDHIPSCDAFRARYFEYINERKTPTLSSCPVCGGGGRVFCMAPKRERRQFAPEDYRTVAAENVGCGVEYYPCPECRAAEYRSGELRERVRHNSAPEFIKPEASGLSYTICGDKLIRDTLWERFQAERPSAPTRDLEADFPLEVAQ